MLGAMCACLGLTSAALPVVPTKAAAAPRPAFRFVYEREPGAERCPDETGIREAVAARLGYDPFPASAAPAAPELSVLLGRDGAGLHARITLADAAGRPLGERNLAARSADCGDLGRAVVLALSLAIDAPAAPAQEAPLPPAASVPRPAPALPAASRTSRAPPRPRANQRWEVGVGASGALGAAPGPALGVDVEAAARWSSFSLGLGGRADLPATQQAAGGSAEAHLLFAELVPCYRHWLLGACGLLAAGTEQADGVGYAGSRHAGTFYTAAGARAFVDVPIRQPLALRIWADLLVPLARTTLLVGAQPVWATPDVSGLLGLAAVLRLP